MNTALCDFCDCGASTETLSYLLTCDGPCRVQDGQPSMLYPHRAYTSGEVTSHNLWSRYDRRFVGIAPINTVSFLELRGEDVVCYSNKIKCSLNVSAVCLRKSLYER